MALCPVFYQCYSSSDILLHFPVALLTDEKYDNLLFLKTLFNRGGVS